VPAASSRNVDTRDQRYRVSSHSAIISILDARVEAVVLGRDYRENARVALVAWKSASHLAPMGKEWQNRGSHS
jgi:hypothetical protein